MRKLLLSTSRRSYRDPAGKFLKTFTASLILIFATILHVSAQDAGIPVNGRVTSTEGDGIPGVSVVEKGTSNGTVTDSTGSYSITVPDSNAVLQFSFAGYATEEVPVGGQSNVSISLTSNSKSDEVVVIGYGTRKRKQVTGAVATVSGEEMIRTPAPNLEQQLQGRVAGVTVTQSSGAPGAAMSVQIRGVGTTRTTEPLYVVDGVILSNVGNQTDIGVGASSPGGTAANGSGGASSTPMSMINPNDIESVEVLKDASAAAIYGARAANGVVIITTKKGKTGGPHVNFETYAGVQKVWNTLDLLNAQQYAEVNNEARQNGGQTPLAAYANPSALGTGTDWQKAMFRSAPIRNHYLSISGGSKNANYYIGGGYFKQEGTMLGTGFQRYTLRVNSDYKIGKRFKVGENLFLARTWNQKEPWTQDRSQIEQMIKISPLIPVYDPNNEGGYGGATQAMSTDALSPVGQAMLLKNIARRHRMLGNIFGEVEIFKGFKYRLNLGGDLIFGNGYQSTPTFYMGTGNNNSSIYSILNQYSANEYNRLAENILSYNRKFGNHDISAVAAYTEQAIVGETMRAQTNGIPNNNITSLGAGSSGTQVIIDGVKNEYAIRSMLGRVAYSFKDKYLLTATIRRDGSSNFGPTKRYAVFPSISGGWRVSQEAFMDNVGFISDMKVRASWGQLGNDNIGAYGYSANLNPNAGYTFGNNANTATGVTQSGLANKDIKWETTAITDIGLDLGMFKNKLFLTFDYYNKVTSGLLVKVPVPMTFGVADAPIQNAGKVQNQGIELALQYQENKGPFQYGFGGNITTIKNKVLSLGSGQPIETGANTSAQTENITRTEVGQSIGYFYGYQTEGIFQDSSQLKEHAKQDGAGIGDIKFKDLNHDGVIDSKDRTKIGSPIPKFIYAFNANIAFMGFDLNVLFQGVHGNQIYNLTRNWLENMGANGNFEYGAAVLNRWTPTNTNTDIPRAIYGDPNHNLRISDRFVESGSYLRLRTIQIGYSLPDRLLKKVTGFSKFRVYVSSYNLLTFTKYSGYDPELAPGNQNNLARGVDAGNYPQARSFILGVQIGF